MAIRDPFDFWYAVNHTEVLISPPGRLETFGTTTIDYHLVTELMDAADKVRVREGRLHAYRPRIVTPDPSAGPLLEGFGEEAAGAYMDWLREHEKELVLLQYGFRVRKQGTREEVVTDRVDAVVERVRKELADRDNPLAALLVGVDDPWEVCLVKLMVDMVQRSAPHHVQALQQDPSGARHRAEVLFRKASRDTAQIAPLAAHLKQHRLFAEYEDRFFALVRSARHSS